MGLLEKNSNLELSIKIKGGNFNNKKAKLYFSDLYSLIEYDSTNGVRDGFATIKINDLPLQFDIKKGKELQIRLQGKRIPQPYITKKDHRIE